MCIDYHRSICIAIYYDTSPTGKNRGCRCQTADTTTTLTSYVRSLLLVHLPMYIFLYMHSWSCILWYRRSMATIHSLLSTTMCMLILELLSLLYEYAVPPPRTPRAHTHIHVCVIVNVCGGVHVMRRGRLLY